MKKTRFNIYFPVLYYIGEFIIIFISTQIMLYLTFMKWSFINNLFIAFWFLISIIFKSHVLGRDISKFKLIQSTLKSLFFFSGFVSILNLLFFQLKFYLTTIAIAASLFYFLMLLYRLTVDTILEKYRATGGNILNCLIIGDNDHGSSLYNEIIKHPELGYRSNGIFTFNVFPSSGFDILDFVICSLNFLCSSLICFETFKGSSKSMYFLLFFV